MMKASEKYTINQNFIPGLPQLPFRQGVGAYEGVCMHATAVYNDSATGERSYETNHWKDAFVHTFTDETQILQVADFDYISWNAGHTANERYLGNELCQSHDADKFEAAYDRWVWLAAYQLFQRKLGVIDGETLLSHHECTLKWHESTHTDPDDYLAEHGKAWADAVKDVTTYYSQMEQEEKAMDELRQQIEELKAQMSMKEIPAWAKEAVDAAVADGLIDNPEGASYDFYRLVTILHRKGII